MDGQAAAAGDLKIPWCFDVAAEFLHLLIYQRIHGAGIFTYIDP